MVLLKRLATKARGFDSGDFCDGDPKQASYLSSDSIRCGPVRFFSRRADDMWCDGGSVHVMLCMIVLVDWSSVAQLGVQVATCF